MGATINELQSLVKSVSLGIHVSNTSDHGVKTADVTTVAECITSTTIPIHDGHTVISECTGKVISSSSITTSHTKSIASNYESKRKLSQRRWKIQNQSKVNASERERKGRLAASILKLKEIIPANPVNLQTRENVLEEALKYISDLKSKMEEMLKNGSSQSAFLEITKLRENVCNLEEERKLYRAVLQSHGIPPILNTNQPWKKKLSIPRVSIKVKKKSINNKEAVETSASTSVFVRSATSTVVDCASSVNVSPTTAVGNSSELQIQAMQVTSTSNEDEIASGPKVVSIDDIHATVSCVEADNVFVNITTTLPSTQHITSNASSSIQTIPLNSSIVIENTSDGISLPCINPIFYKIPSAQCTPTWSQARMQVPNAEKIPNFTSLPVEAIRPSKDTDVAANVKNLTSHSVSCPISVFDHPLSSSSSATSLKRANSHITDRNRYDYYVERVVSGLGREPIAASPSNCTDKFSSALPNALHGSTSGGDSNPTVSSLLSAQAVVQCAATAIAGNSARPQSLEFSSKSNTVVVTELPLLSWLRTYDTSTSDTNNTSIKALQTFSVTSDAINHIQNASPAKQNFLSQNNAPSSKKPTYNSFNIASLMKSKDVMQEPLVSSSNTNSTVVASSKATFPIEQDVPDICGATPKDIFHQSFENDFLDYLPNLSHFTTPEPPARHLPGKLDAFGRNESFLSPANNNVVKSGAGAILEKRKEPSISEDFNELLHTESNDQTSVGSLFLERGLTMDRLWPMNEHRSFGRNQTIHEPTSRSLCATGQLGSRNFLGRFPLPINGNASTAVNVPFVPTNTATVTSLWQPGITNTLQSKMSLPEMSQLSDCFSPHQYLNNNTSRLPHANSQPSNNLKSSTGWIPHHVTRNRFSVPAVVTQPAVISSVASTANTSRQDNERKRKAVKSSQVAKRKKSTGKPVTAAVRKEPTTFPRIVGYQYTTQVYSQHPCVPSNPQHPSNMTGVQLPASNTTKLVPNDRRNVFAPSNNPVLTTPHVTYNTEYGGQPRLFHSSQTVGPQAPAYSTPHRSYHFAYNHHMNEGQQPSRQMYMPQFGNSNNNNSTPAPGLKPFKGSQYNIRQILS